MARILFFIPESRAIFESKLIIRSDSSKEVLALPWKTSDHPIEDEAISPVNSEPPSPKFEPASSPKSKPASSPKFKSASNLKSRSKPNLNKQKLPKKQFNSAPMYTESYLNTPCQSEPRRSPLYHPDIEYFSKPENMAPGNPAYGLKYDPYLSAPTYKSEPDPNENRIFCNIM